MFLIKNLKNKNDLTKILEKLKENGIVISKSNLDKFNSDMIEIENPNKVIVGIFEGYGIELFLNEIGMEQDILELKRIYKSFSHIKLESFIKKDISDFSLNHEFTSNIKEVIKSKDYSMFEDLINSATKEQLNTPIINGDAKSLQSFTPLLTNVIGNKNMFKLLISKKEIDLNLVNTFSNSPLAKAVTSSKYFSELEALIEKKVPDLNKTAAFLALLNDNTKGLKLLLENNYLFDFKDSISMSIVKDNLLSMDKDKDVVKTLFKFPKVIYYVQNYFSELEKEKFNRKYNVRIIYKNRSNFNRNDKTIINKLFRPIASIRYV